MMETYTYQQYQQSAAALADRLGDFRPEVLLILGSGLGSLGDQVEQPLVVPYAQVPHCAGPQGAVCLWAALGAECGGDAGPAPHL